MYPIYQVFYCNFSTIEMFFVLLRLI